MDAERPLGFFLLAAIIVVLAYPTGRDSLLLLIPVLTASLYANRIGGPAIILMVIALSAAAGCKISVFPLAIGAFVLIDFLSVARRDWPYKTICLLLAASILFAATGQDLADFPAYVLARY